MKINRHTLPILSPATIQNGGRQKQVLDEINSYLGTYANPYESRAEEGLSTGWTAGIRDVAEEYDLSKNTFTKNIVFSFRCAVITSEPM